METLFHCAGNNNLEDMAQQFIQRQVEKLRVYSERECDLHYEDGVPCAYYDTETGTCQWNKRTYGENK